MYAFRQRPLTWLFLIALACVNALAFARSYHGDWYEALLEAQLIIAGGWLALGRSHRLARASVVVAVILGSALAYCYGQDFVRLLWSYVLATMIFVVGVTAASCWCCLAALHAFRRERTASSARWQFPLAEIFGWTILVAVAAYAVPRADFRHLADPSVNGAVGGAVAAVAGIAMTLFLRPHRGGNLASVGVAALAVAALAALFLPHYNLGVDYQPLVRIGVVVGMWILVQRLDAQIADRSSRQSTVPTSVRLYDPSSDEQRRYGN